MEKGVVIIQSSPNGKDYTNLIEPLCNFFAQHPRGMVLPVKISSKGYYRIIVAYQTQRYVGKKLVVLDNNEDRFHVEIYTFRITKDNLEGMEIEDDGYSLTTLEKGETLKDYASTTVGFIIDKLGTNYEVKVNGRTVNDHTAITENGYYTIQVMRRLNYRPGRFVRLAGTLIYTALERYCLKHYGTGHPMPLTVKKMRNMILLPSHTIG